MSSYVDSPAEAFDLRPRNWLEAFAARMQPSHAERRRQMLATAQMHADAAAQNKHSQRTQRQTGIGMGGNGFFLTNTTLNRDSYIEDLYAKNREAILEGNRIVKAAEADPRGPEAAELAAVLKARKDKAATPKWS